MFRALFVDFVWLSPFTGFNEQATFFFWIVLSFWAGFFTGRTPQNRA